MNIYVANTVPSNGFMVIEAESRDEAIGKVMEYMIIKGLEIEDYCIYVSLANKI
jgi:hypothetical protein